MTGMSKDFGFCQNNRAERNKRRNVAQIQVVAQQDCFKNGNNLNKKTQNYYLIALRAFLEISGQKKRRFPASG